MINRKGFYTAAEMLENSKLSVQQKHDVMKEKYLSNKVEADKEMNNIMKQIEFSSDNGSRTTQITFVIRCDYNIIRLRELGYTVNDGCQILTHISW